MKNSSRPSLFVSGLLAVGMTVLPVWSQQEQEDAAPPVDDGPVAVDLSHANRLVLAGAYTEADAALASLAEEHPDDPRVLLMRGEVLLALGKPAEALPLLQRTVELDGDRPRAHFQLATALQSEGNREGALEAYAKEITITGDPRVHVLARLNRSLLLEQGKEWAGAASELEAVVAIEPGRLQAYGDLATLYLHAGKLEEAARSLERGLDHGYRSARHYYVLGARFYEKKAYESAVETLRQALAIDPGFADAERTLAGALDQMGQAPAALEHLKRYLELKPDAPDAADVAERIRSIEGR
jgi:tetratricopeptide (TPR) repeat protein